MQNGNTVGPKLPSYLPLKPKGGLFGNLAGGMSLNQQTSTPNSQDNQGGILNQLSYLTGSKTGKIESAPVQQAVGSNYIGTPQTPATGTTQTPSAPKVQPATSAPSSSASPQATQPAVQSSYQGGQAVPAIGTPGYQAAQSLGTSASGSQPYQIQNTPFTAAANSGVPGIWSTALAGLAGTQPNTGTSGAISSLQGQANGQNPATANIQNLTNIGQNGSQDVQQAVQNVKGLEQAQSEIANNPNVAAEVASGRGQAITGQIQAAETALGNKLNEQGQQITSSNAGATQQLAGQGQQITAAQNAGTLGNTAQANQIGAQGSAVAATQPQLGAYGQTYYSPQTGQGAGSVSPSDPLYPALQQYAKLYASGQQSAIPVSITGNPVLNAQVLQMAQQANPNFNVNAAQGTAAGQQAASQQLVNMQAANVAAKGIQGTVQQFLQANPGLNPAGFTAGNNITQWLQGKQLGDANYQTLANYLNEYTNTLAPILGVGGDPTNLKTEIAQGFINGAASGQNISQVLQNISTLADQKVQNIQSGAYGGGQVAGGSTDTSSVGLYSF